MDDEPASPTPLSASTDWLTLRETQAYLRRGYRQVRRLLEAAEIYADPYSGRVMVSRASCDAYAARVARGELADATRAAGRKLLRDCAQTHAEDAA